MPPPQHLLNHLPHSSISTPAHLLQSSIRESFPIPIYKPSYTTVTSLSHLQRKILSARAKNQRVKATSDPCSRSSHEASLNGTQILSTEALDTIHRTRNTVTAQAGVKLSNLPIPIVPPRKCVGSSIANMLLAHGGFSECRVSDVLLAISVVDSRGRLRVYAKRDFEGMFDAVLDSFGMAGVIYDATFVAAYAERVVRVERSLQSMDTLSIEGLRRIVNGNTATEISWMPFNSGDDPWKARSDKLVVKTVASTMLELTSVKNVRYTTIPEFLSRNLYQLSSGGYSKFEAWHTRHILRNAFDIPEGEYVTTLREAVKDEYEIRSTVQESVLFPLRLLRNSDWGRIVSAWDYVTNLVESEAEEGLYRLNLLMKLRFVGGETDCGCVLTIVSAVGTKGWVDFARAVVREWTRMGGRWMMHRGGIRGIEIGVEDIRLWVRNCGLDDCGMFEDDVVGFGDVRIVERFDGMSDVTDEEVFDGVVISERHELWWVWVYLVLYVVVWCRFFGYDALVSVTNFLKARN